MFFGLSAMHEKRDLLRAVMEGVSYSLMDCLAVFGDMGLTVDRMAACGGGGSSPFWRQMLADIYGCGISPVVSREGPALGVALLARRGRRGVRQRAGGLRRRHRIRSPPRCPTGSGTGGTVNFMTCIGSCTPP